MGVSLTMNFIILASLLLSSLVIIEGKQKDYSPATDETSNKPTTDIEGGMIKCCEESKCCKDWRTNMPECQKCAGNCCEKFKIPRNSEDCVIETLLCQRI